MHPKSTKRPSTVTVGIAAAAVVVVAGLVISAWPKHVTAPTTTANTNTVATLTITTSDGVKLAATFQLPPGLNQVPAVILLHQYGADRHEWDPFLQQFLDAGFAVLSYDMRGFGASPLKTIPKDQQTHLDSLPLDFPAILGYLHQQARIDQSRISIVGASVGADAAFVAIGSNLGLHRAALLSPVVRGTALDGHLVDHFSPSGILGFSNTAEQPDLNTYMAHGSDPKQTTIIANGGHGIELLTQPSVIKDIIQWIKQ